MKSTELENRLMAELNHWFPRQLQNIYDDFYLYYMESTAEHDGGFAIYKTAPANPDVKLAWPQRINKGWTVEQNFYNLRDIVFKLPICEE